MVTNALQQAVGPRQKFEMPTPYQCFGYELLLNVNTKRFKEVRIEYTGI